MAQEMENDNLGNLGLELGDELGGLESSPDVQQHSDGGSLGQLNDEEKRNSLAELDGDFG